MAFFNLYADAQLTVVRSHIEDPYGNPLNADDLPHDEPQYLGSPTDEAALIAGTGNLIAHIKHVVPEWSSGLPVVVNQETRTTAHNGFVYRAQGPGNTGGAEPTWPAVLGATVVDNDVTWECIRRTTEPEVMRIALTQIGLDSATPGASLDLGVTSIPALPLNALEIWVRVDAVPALTNVAELWIGSDDWLEEAAA